MIVLKRCSSCAQELELDCFNNRASAKDGKQSKCRTCQAKIFQDYYREHKEEYFERTRKFREKV